MRLKLLILLVVAAAVFFSLDHVWVVWIQPEVMTQLALKQMERCTQPTRWIRTIGQLQQWLELAGIVACLAAVAVLGFWSRLGRGEGHAPANPTDSTEKEKKIMKRSWWPTLVLVALLAAGGCIKPYHESVLAEISNSQEGFLIELEEENGQANSSPEEYLKAQQDKQVAMAEAAAASERTEALKLQGEGEAEKEVEIARGKAQAVQQVADATAYEIEKLAQNPEAYIQLKRLEIEMARYQRWDGSYPQVLFSGGSEAGLPPLLLEMPKVDLATAGSHPAPAPAASQSVH